MRTDPTHDLASARVMGNADLRLHNLSAIVKAVHDGDAITRASLARTTGLTKTTVGNLVAELVDADVLVEGEVTRGSVGRPSVTLRVNRERFAVAVLDTGATFFTTTVCDLAGTVLHQDTHQAKPEGLRPSRLDLIASKAAASLAAAQEAGVELIGVVIAPHGPADPTRGAFLGSSAPSVLIADQVRSVVGSGPGVMVENDANLAALAEWDRFGAEGVQNLLSLSGELSVGAGLVIDGHLYQGSAGWAGVVSHTLVDPNGPPCTCGRTGCWSAYVALPRVLRTALPDLSAGLERIPGYALVGVNALTAAASAGDPHVVAALEEAGRWLGWGAANLMNILDPELVVVGGYFPAVAPWMMESAWEAFAERVAKPVQPTEVLRISDLDNAPYRVGAADLERARVIGGAIHYATAQLVAQPLTAGRSEVSQDC